MWGEETRFELEWYFADVHLIPKTFAAALGKRRLTNTKAKPTLLASSKACGDRGLSLLPETPETPRGQTFVVATRAMTS